jgi:LPS-assembly protein
MKNNFKFLNIFILISIYFIFFINLVYSKEINFKALEVLTYENGNIIIGEGKAEAKIDKEIEIFADKVTYYKSKEQVVAEGNVVVIDVLNKTTINTKKAIYNKNQNQITSFGETFFDIDKKYNIESSNVNFHLTDKIILSDSPTSLKDNFNNLIQTTSFKYSLNNEILKGQNINLIDNEKNKYFVTNGMIKLKEYILLGKDIKINLRNDSFGIKENEPKLKGNSILYKNNKTLITKGIFTSCKENNNCPPWSIVSKEIIHDKNKKEIHYKNAWLRIYNKPVLYFPKFFHPDPTVKRKSGFLIPTFGDSKNLGASVNLPYFHVISERSDFTFKPRFFSSTEYLLQSEYREVSKNSSHILDFSFNKTDEDNNNGRKTHFFSNSKFNIDEKFFDENEIYLQIEKVSNDNYTKLYSLESTSPIVKDTSVLENIVRFSGSQDNFYLDISLESYETMNKPTSDRYEFVYPNYSLLNTTYLNDGLLDSFEFVSKGNQKKFSTNISEIVQVNDFILKSKNLINKLGVNNQVSGIMKNVNSDGKNSSKFKDDSQSEILSMVSYDLDLPLFKNDIKFNNFLTPKMSFRYSPNDTKSLKNESRSLTSDNIFSLNRIGFDETIEGGTSLTLGMNYEKKNKDDNSTFLSSRIATVYREEINENLPISTTLDKKQSDFVGEISFIPNEIFQFDYNYSLNNDFDEINLHRIENTFTVNNFVNKFTFYEENNLIGKKSYIENELGYTINDRNSLIFTTRENKENNLTEFYNLIYEYKNDCLIASLRYNKEYYSNTSIKPSEELFFNITLIPLGSTQTDSLLDN